MSAQTFGARVIATVGDPRQAGPAVSPSADAVTAGVSTWLMGGLMLDAWAHSNVPELETFFTPWHAAFYSGFMATAGWVLYLVWRNLRVGLRGFAAVPAGYRSTVLALVVFAVSGIADWAWHTVFGIEETLNILFSPSHLGLAASMFIIVTSPLRSAFARTELGAAPAFRQLWPAMWATGMAAALVMLFLGYGNAVRDRPGGIVDAFSNSDSVYADYLAAELIISNLILLLPLLYLARRWQLPFGAATLTMLPTVVLSGAENEGHNPSILLTFVVAAIGVDVLNRLLRPAGARPAAYQLFAALAPFLTWSLYFGAASVSERRLPEIVEFWTGAPIVAALVGWLFAVLLLPPRPPVAEN